MSKSVGMLKKENVLSLNTWTPHVYQKRAVKWLLEHANAGLFLDPGLGKTSITLAAIKLLKTRGVFRGALIIAPLRVCHLVWPEEIKKWSNFSGLRVEILHDKDKEKALFRDADVYLINPEGLDWLFGPLPINSKPGKDAPAEVHRAWLRMWAVHQKELARAAPLTKEILRKTNVLVIDESTKFKNHNSKRFKVLKQFLYKFDFRWILTGTPAPNGYTDLFGQCFVMDEGLSLGRYVTHYRNAYFDQVGFGGFTCRLKKDADKAIHAKLRASVLSLCAEDYLDMPRMIHNVVKVNLPGKARDVYRDMETEMLATIENCEVEAVNAAVASMKCRQIANGAVYQDKRASDKYLNIHDEKINALMDLVEQLSGQPLLLAYEFGHDLERLKKAFPKVPAIGISSSSVDKKIVDAFNAGDVSLLLGHPASMAHGLNLQGACYNVGFFSIFWNFEFTDQFIRRVYRQGQQAKTVFVHTFVARDTVDEVMLKVRASKNKTQRHLITELKKSIKT